MSVANVGAALAATTAGVAAVSNLVSGGPASGLSVSAGGGTAGFFSNLFAGLTAPKVPMPNPLFKYASYTYQIGLGVLTDAQLKDPLSYMKGQSLPLIFKDGGADPLNRVKTPYGAFEFYIDKLEITTLPSLQPNAITNVSNITFQIIEPYSMGMFMIALQQAAQKAGHDNWVQAPFLLTLDFKGNTETGAISSIPKTSRKIPIKLTEANVTVTEAGAVYSCSAVPWNAPAHSKATAGLKSDHSVSGKTVQEILQTGEKSLQAVVNAKYKQLKEQGIVPVPDEVLILFPNEYWSDSGNPASDSKVTVPGSATAGVDVDSIAKQLGVTRTGTIGSNKNVNLIQSEANCNALGKASIGYGDARKGDQRVGKDNKVYDKSKSTNVRANNFIDPTTGEMRFTQNMDIMNVINQVLMNSDYVSKSLSADQVDEKGQRQWWHIDCQIYNVTTDANYPTTGTKPRLIVYRVIPYLTHTANKSSPNTRPIGLTVLGKEIVKVYNYIYTGKNIDILKFNIEFGAAIVGVMGQAKLSQTQDSVKAVDSSGAKDKNKADPNPVPKGNAPSKEPGTTPTAMLPIENTTRTDKKGGGGNETVATRAARSWHDAVTAGSEMVNLNMEILGDPYYIIQSGMGTYTARPVSQNLNDDGSMCYQNGEVHIGVGFSTPIDINLSSGLYDFGKSSKTAPVKQWTGIYKLTQVVSKFNGGLFTQTIEGVRLPGQELPLSYTSLPSGTYNVTNPAGK
jgi:hypothetical protein